MLQLEELIADLPPLSIFDDFVVKACGFFCKESCDSGFPSVVLDQWRSCLLDSGDGEGEGFTLEPDSNLQSTQFVKVESS